MGENAKGTHEEIYKSHTSVISTHFVDQVQIFFFLMHCINNNNNNIMMMRAKEDEKVEKYQDLAREI